MEIHRENRPQEPVSDPRIVLDESDTKHERMFGVCSLELYIVNLAGAT